MDKAEALRILRGDLRDRGLTGSSRTYRWEWPELLWMIDLEQTPKTNQVGMVAGVCPAVLATQGWPSRANNCPVVMWPDMGGEPFGLGRWEARNILDLSSGVHDHARREGLAAIADAVANVFLSVRLVNDLRDMSSEGRLGGFVRADARQLLQGE